MEIDDINVNLNKRKGSVCFYCGENHTYDKCKHPDVIKFSEYLVNLYKELYQLQSSLQNKYMAAYNLLSEYSVNLLVTAGRSKSNWCKFKKTYSKKNLDKKDVINELTDCMFAYIKYTFPDLIEGNVNKSFTQSFKNSIADLGLFNNKIEPSAPQIENMYLNDEKYKDIHQPSAPPMTEIGGKRRRTKRRLNKNKKTKRRR